MRLRHPEVEPDVFDLAVVLIARNQVWNVERLVRSVTSTPEGAAAALVLVDSASSDGTPQRARELGVTVLELDGSQRLTAAAGRVAGQEATDSEYVLFLDGDMELTPGWLGQALEQLNADPSLAGIAGEVRDVPKSWTRSVDDVEGTDLSGEQDTSRVPALQAPFIGGASLYRRSALEAVGSFDRSLFSDEEPELGLRLRAKGYKLLFDGRLMVFHYSDPPDQLRTTIGRWRRNLYLGAGQIVRKHLGRPLLGTWLRERGFWIPPAIALLGLLVAILIWIATDRPGWVIGWAALMATVFLGLSLRRKSLASAAETILERFFHFDGFVRGFFSYGRPPFEGKV